MKRIIRLTENDLTRIVKKTLSEEQAEKPDRLSRPVMTYRQLVGYILEDIALEVSNTLDDDNYPEYESISDEIPDYLIPYVKMIERYVNSDDFIMRVHDAMVEVYSDTKIAKKIANEIIEKSIQ